MKKSNFWLLLMSSLVFQLTACNSTEEVSLLNRYTRGAFLVNQGNFSDPNGSVSFYNPQTKNIERNAYEANNQEAPGGIIENMEVSSNVAVIVTNMPDQVILADPTTLMQRETVTSAEQLQTPRYAAIGSERVYISVWGPYVNGYDLNPGHILAINATSGEIEGNIKVARGPEYVLLDGSKLWVTHKYYGGGNDTITILNAQTLEVERHLKVEELSGGIGKTGAGEVWVYYTSGSLVFFNATTFEETRRVALEGSVSSKAQLIGNTFYYLGSDADGSTHLYKLDVAQATPVPQIVLTEKDAKSFWVDASSGDIYLGVGSYDAPGELVHYSAQGTELNRQVGGVYPYQILPSLQ